MFRKIHSNRDPNDTIVTEIKKEFHTYFEKVSKQITQKIEKRPNVSFSLMVISIVISAGLSFTVLRNKEPTDQNLKQIKVNAVSEGFGQILNVSAAIKQSLALKNRIDSLSAKKSLSKIDSQTLINDLDKLHQLNKPFHK